MHIYGDFEGFPLIVPCWGGNIMTPAKSIRFLLKSDFWGTVEKTSPKIVRLRARSAVHRQLLQISAVRCVLGVGLLRTCFLSKEVSKKDT